MNKLDADFWSKLDTLRRCFTVVPYRTPVGSRIAETMRVGRDFMRIAKENPNVERVSLVAGRGLSAAYSTLNKGALKGVENS